MKPIITINIAPIRKAYNAAAPYILAAAFGSSVLLLIFNLRPIFRVAIETLKFFFN